MKLNFIGAEEYLPGIRRILPLLRAELAEDGVRVTLKKVSRPTLEVTSDGENAQIVFCEKCQLFRAIGLLAEHVGRGERNVALTETPQFRMNGVMFDLSQGNAVFTQEKMKEIIARLALMGHNTLMLYLEDNYEVEGEPYFGYMRPRYTKEMLRELDDCAFSLGIEMIPCIQTLAHLTAALRWDTYAAVTDTPDCLLVGKEETYALIERHIKNAKEPFRSRKMHVGMDEAFHLGRGNYLTENGYRPKKEIMREHLARVSEICRRNGVEPMMWSDMYFSSLDEYWNTTPVTEQAAAMVPDGMRCVLWDYEIHGESLFENHLKLTQNTVFAGGCWAWLSFGLNAKFTQKCSDYQLRMCKKYGIRDVFMTAWGDNGTECPITVNLYGAQIFAEHGYAETLDREKFRARFAFCCDADADDFEKLTLIDDVTGTAECTDPPGYDINMSKYFMWQDVLCGLFDFYAEKLPTEKHYRHLGAALAGASERNPAFAEEFRFFTLVCRVLEKKAGLGVRLTQAYRAKDRAALAVLKGECSQILDLAKALREEHRKLWYRLYQPLGWETMDARYGYLFNRLETAVFTLDGYLGGEISRIEELERERLPYNKRDEYPRCITPFFGIASGSVMY